MRAHADQLVLLFTSTMSLQQWRDTGMLGREWALYHRLLEFYPRVLLVTYGGREDRGILAEIAREEGEGKVALVANENGLEMKAYLAQLPGLVAEAVGPAGSVVVKTNQMVWNDVAVDIAAALWTRGVRAGLIARGGYWWSSFVEHANGAGSPLAIDAIRCERRLCRAADLVIGTTREMLDGLIARHSLERSRTFEIPNYVVVGGCASPVAREPGTVLYAGQLVPRKRVDVLVRAAAQLKATCREFTRMDIVGAGPEAKALRALAGELGAPVRFEARLAHEELLRRMAGVAVYAQASELEGHPKTVIEAMATGAPVVVAPSPGLGGVVVHGETGVVANADPASFAAAIARLLGDDARRTRIGEAASRASLSKFGLDHIVKQELEAHELAVRNADGARCTALSIA